MRPTSAEPPAVLPERRLRRTRQIPALPPIVVAIGTSLAVCGLLLLLTRTLYTDGGRLVNDFHSHAWYIQQQAHWLAENHAPSLFLTGSTAAFYPVFAFYGGTLFVAAGAIALVAGSPETAQSIVYTLALAAAYGGWLWLGRLAGLRSWRPHAAAVLSVTAPYVLTNIYSRQDLPETVATSSIPLLLASTISVLRADRLHAGPAAALAISTIAFGGAHNLTLLWGTTILVLTGGLVALAVPPAREMVTRRGVLRVLSVAVPAMAVNAWYLIPDLAYHSQTVVAARVDEWKALLHTPNSALEPQNLLGLSRKEGYTLPVLAIAWVAIAAVVARDRLRSAWGRTLGVLSLLTLALVVVLLHPPLLSPLPDPWLMVQGGSRLDTFAVFGICGTVIAALALLQDRTTWFAATLLPIMLASVIAAAGQAGDAPLAVANYPVDPEETYPYSLGDFGDAHQKVLPPATVAAGWRRSDVHDGRLEVLVRAAPGTVVRTNLLSPAEMLHIEGAHVVGRWKAGRLDAGWQPLWYLVLAVDDTPDGQPHIVISEARSFPIVAGKVISLLGLLGLAAVAVVVSRPALLRARARRRLRRS